MKTSFQQLVAPSELAAIRRIADSIWPETFRDILSPEQIVYMMKMMYAPEVMERELAEGYRFDVLKIDGEPAGYMVYAVYDGKESTVKLHKLYLLSKYHGQGFGTLMLNHVMEVVRGWGFRTLRLNVNKYNARAIRAYERNGFITAESVKNDIGGGFFMDDYVMDKAL